MAIIIKCILIVAIAICALVKFIKRKTQTNIRTWLLIAAALFGLFANFLFPGYVAVYFAAIELSDIGFVLAAIAALTNKRVWALLGAIWFLLLEGLFPLLGFTYYDLVNAITCILLVIAVVWQYKSQKVFPLAALIILSVVGLLLGNFRVNLALAATIAWLSPMTDKDLEGTKVNKKPAQPQQSPAEMADKLKALESLQELLNSGVITQEEFDAKKKQLLG